MNRSSTSKRLFILRQGRKGEPVKGVYFSNKMDAKVARDSGAYGTDLVVSHGPDHRRANHD